MREIKFRGLTKDNKFVYGSLVETTNFLKHKPYCHSKHWIVCSSFGNGGWFNIWQRYHVKTDTVGQFTGVKDKKGNDIYEGDIISISFTIYGQQPYTESRDVTRTGMVKYYPSKGFVLTKCIEVDNDTGDIKNNISPMNINSARSTIIGNIHENQELLVKYESI